MTSAVSVLVATFLNGACVLVPEAIDVREVREFPECGGWLAVDSKGRVAAEYTVERVATDQGERWIAAPTREQAVARVEQVQGEGRVRPLHGVAVIAATPLLLAGYVAAGIIEPPRHFDRSADGGNPPQVGIRVVGADGQPIPNAQIEWMPAVHDLPRYVDGAGQRILGTPDFHGWEPPERLLESLHRNGEVFLVEGIELEWESRHFSGAASGKGSRDAPSDRRPQSIRVVDPAGTLHFEVARARRNRTGEIGFVGAWAPGFEPGWVALREVPGSVTVELAPTANSVRERDACQRLALANRAFERAIGPNRLLASGKIDHATLDAAEADLRALHEDATLPEWLRANARVALEEHLRLKAGLYEHAGSMWVWPGDSTAGKRAPAVAEALEQLTAMPRTFERARAGRNADPQAAAVELAELLAACRELGLDPGGPTARAERQAQLLETARTLLARVEAFGEDQPHVETLRCLIALAEGDRARAVALSGGLDSASYFAIFYGALRLP